MTGEKMSANKKQQIGQNGEQIAAEFLSANSYQVLAQNYRKNSGEIDLICLDNNEIVFVEVKTRTNLKYGTPELAVDQKKLMKIIETGLQYLQETQNQSMAWRVDVVAILLAQSGKPEISHYKGIRIYD